MVFGGGGDRTSYRVGRVPQRDTHADLPEPAMPLRDIRDRRSHQVLQKAGEWLRIRRCESSCTTT